MINRLDSVLRRLVRQAGADAAVIWSMHGQPAEAVLLTTSPAGLLPVDTTWSIANLEQWIGPHAVPARLAGLIPATVTAVLPSSPTAACSVQLGDTNLYVLLLWCAAEAGGELSDELRRFIREEISYLAVSAEDIRVTHVEMGRLGAIVDDLEVGLVSVDPGLGQASLNDAAAKLLQLPPGVNTAVSFAMALNRLAERALNGEQVTAVRCALQRHDHITVDCIWQFPERPTYLRIVSTPTRHDGVVARVWAFYDQSEMSEALAASDDACDVLQAHADALLDPQALLEAVSDADGRVVDFVYRAINEATCDYMGFTHEELIGSGVVETMPGIRETGLFDACVECLETGAALVLNDFAYADEVTHQTLRYDVRATRATSSSIALTWRNVTARFQAAQRISQSEERLRLLTESLGEIVCRISSGGILLWISDSVEQALGEPPARYIGRNIRDFIAVDQHGVQLARLDAVARGEPTMGRVHITDLRGVPHWIHVFVKPYFDAEGNAHGFVSTLRIIDGEVAVESEMEDTRRRQVPTDDRYRQLMETSNVGMCLMTIDGRFDVVNQALCDFLGRDAEALRALSWHDLTPDIRREADRRITTDLLAGRVDTYRTKKQFIHADGHLIWGEVAASVLRGTAGEPERLVAQILDITTEVEARRTIQQLASKVQAQADRMASELNSAANYVASLLPVELDGTIQVHSRYQPSRELAGDSFDYRWIDDDHFIAYLLDVSGHGIEPALLSISVHNMLHCGFFPLKTLRHPGRLLNELNRLFQMDRQAGKYFTIWYGVFQASTRTLRYASAGHPPALAVTHERGGPSVTPLAAKGIPVGLFERSNYASSTYVVPPGGMLLVYSDGVYEIEMADDRTGSPAEFIEACRSVLASPDFSLDALIDHQRARARAGEFNDDVSIFCLTIA